MGKRRLVIFIILLVFSINNSFSQSIIKGSVKDSINNKSVYSNVILKDTNDKIITYTITKNDGSFELSTPQIGEFYLQISALSYQTQQIDVVVNNENEFTFDVLLQPKSLVLDEVVVEGNRLITIKKDTIIFDAQSFAQGNEEVVEDLLKRIPGLNIDEYGTIKIGDKEVEKVMVEGDDFFEHGYKVLTKNMPSQPIDKVEVLQNFSNNRLLKGIEESDKVALNLTLKEDAKRVWFGNLKGGYDISFNNRFEAKGNLMNFGKKNKFYFLTNFNNIGYDATGDINHLIRPFRFNEPASIGDDQSADYFSQLNANPLNFKRSRTNFNNSKVLSFNAIFNPTKKLKIKALTFFNSDENQYFRNRIDNVDVNGTSFTNTEDYELEKSKNVLFGKIEMINNVSKNQMLEGVTKYNYDVRLDKSDLLFNENPINENLNNLNFLFDQKITYTNKIKDKTTLLLTGRYINESIHQDYEIDNFIFQDLFTDSENIDVIEQLLNNNMTFAGFEAHLLKRSSKGHLIELKAGNKYRKDILNSSISLIEDQTPFSQPQGYQNNFKYLTNDTYLDNKYRFEIKDFALIGKLQFHQLFNKIETQDINKSQNPFFINSSFGLDWKLNRMNRVRTTFANTNTNLKLIEVYNNYTLNGFRDFHRGTGDFNQLEASSSTLQYQFGNWNDRFFSNTTIVYSKNHDFLSTNSLISPNFSLSENIIIKDRELFDIKTNFDYYLKSLQSNFKVELGYTQSDFKNIVNDSDLREVENINFKYGAEFRSAFNGIFNFNLGTKWTRNQITTTRTLSITDNMSFIDLNLILNEKWDTQIQTERYYFGNLQNDNTYYFLDLSIRYQPKENKLALFLDGKNLLNTATFRSFSISDIGTTTTEYRLLPRFILVKAECRF
ncbi:MAG: carboxypeptidase-like regulatory domain-containing protein [Cyclobacteriaceae bacterium]|nr:carboxypeptidase-like regulatory domain-containing protein [Cyclobacteriaceae bacterium]MCH8517883.1 carboxypeptidase-like regulatory domain-containing protein [Cyclobacteriaceae bacterium]